MSNPPQYKYVAAFLGTLSSILLDFGDGFLVPSLGGGSNLPLRKLSPLGIPCAFCFAEIIPCVIIYSRELALRTSLPALSPSIQHLARPSNDYSLPCLFAIGYGTPLAKKLTRGPPLRAVSDPWGYHSYTAVGADTLGFFIRLQTEIGPGEIGPWFTPSRVSTIALTPVT